MDVDSVIARAAGLMLQRGTPAADVIQAVERLRSLAKQGQSLSVELHGVRVRLPARTDRQAPRGRMTRETRG